MQTFGPFEFQTADGRSVSINVTIDPAKIAAALAQRAWDSETHRTSACGKGVIAEVVRYQTKTDKRC